MNKNCLIYLTTTEKSFSNFLSLKNNIENIIDCYYFFDTKDINSTIFDFKDNYIIWFNGHKVWKNYNDYIKQASIGDLSSHYIGNPLFLTIEVSKLDKFQEYDNYYFIEDDIVMPNGYAYDFFNKCESIECDLLLCTDQFQNNAENWYWYSLMPRNIRHQYSVHHYIQFFRLSKSGCNLISEKFNNEHKAHSEAAIPSIIYRNGLSTKFIDNELLEYHFILDYKRHPEYTYHFDYKENTWYHPIKIT